MKLEDVYGAIAKEFIHVHHLIPISEIKEDYQMDLVKDLIPVCQNCLTMQHRKVDRKWLSIEKLTNNTSA